MKLNKTLHPLFNMKCIWCNALGRRRDSLHLHLTRESEVTSLLYCADRVSFPYTLYFLKVQEFNMTQNRKRGHYLMPQLNIPGKSAYFGYSINIEFVAIIFCVCEKSLGCMTPPPTRVGVNNY